MSAANATHATPYSESRRLEATANEPASSANPKFSDVSKRSILGSRSESRHMRGWLVAFQSRCPYDTTFRSLSSHANSMKSHYDADFSIALDETVALCAYCRWRSRYSKCSGFYPVSVVHADGLASTCKYAIIRGLQ
ncbi:hypothetical protein CHU98_g7517 [Xylaria longipes]|nr:hypothetical protein CHU98_g7517 [Xylaria longipes]